MSSLRTNCSHHSFIVLSWSTYFFPFFFTFTLEKKNRAHQQKKKKNHNPSYVFISLIFLSNRSQHKTFEVINGKNKKKRVHLKWVDPFSSCHCLQLLVVSWFSSVVFLGSLEWPLASNLSSINPRRKLMVYGFHQYIQTWRQGDGWIPLFSTGASQVMNAVSPHCRLTWF